MLNDLKYITVSKEIKSWISVGLYSDCLCVRSSGYSVFAIGVADVDFVELQAIGSKPSERHVFVVDDFDAFDTIKENLITFICETATSSKFAQYRL